MANFVIKRMALQCQDTRDVKGDTWTIFFQISLKKFKSRKTRWDKIRMTNIFLFVYLVYLFYFNFKNFCYHVKYFLSQIYNCCASKCKLIISNKQFSAASINNQLNISNKYWGCALLPPLKYKNKF